MENELSISQEDIQVLVKMATFQIKVMNRLPKEVLAKAMMEAITSGDVKLEEMPSPDEVDRLCDNLGLPASIKNMN